MVAQTATCFTAELTLLGDPVAFFTPKDPVHILPAIVCGSIHTSLPTNDQQYFFAVLPSLTFL